MLIPLWSREAASISLPAAISLTLSLAPAIALAPSLAPAIALVPSLAAAIALTTLSTRRLGTRVIVDTVAILFDGPPR